MLFQPTKHLRSRWRPSLVLPLLLSVLVHAVIAWPSLRSGFREAGADSSAPWRPVLAPLAVQLVNRYQPASQAAPNDGAAASTGTTPQLGALAPKPSGGESGGGTPLYYKLSQLDGPTLPVSAPDISRLRGLVFSGQVIRLRLWISPQGRVEHIDVLHASAADQDAVAEVLAMYYATLYTKPQRLGVPVATRMDIEMDFAPEGVERRAITLLGPAQTLPNSPASPGQL